MAEFPGLTCADSPTQGVPTIDTRMSAYIRCTYGVATRLHLLLDNPIGEEPIETELHALERRVFKMGTQKVSMNLTDDVIEALKDVAKRENVTMTEVTRRAISIFKYLDDAQNSGKSVLVRDPVTKETERIVFT